MLLEGPEAKAIQGFPVFEANYDFLRNHMAKGFKRPLRLSIQGKWLLVFQNTAQYLMLLKSVDGQPVMQHRRKTFMI